MPSADRQQQRWRAEVALLSKIADLVRREGRVHYSVAAAHVRRSPTWVAQRATLITTLFEDICYTSGYFYVLPSYSKREEERKEGEE